MRRAYRRMCRVVPCTNKEILRTESWKDIEEILKTKLATIKEEPEPVDVCEQEKWAGKLHLQVAKSVKKISFNKAKKKGKFFASKFSLKESYAIFMAAGIASKGSSFGGLVH